MKKYLQEKIFQIISEAADEQQQECYVIGGFVRDIYLKRPSKDIDVVVVGSGIELAKRVSDKLGKRASLTVFKTFGTAQVKLKELEVEFVGARKESYNRESRNPVVEDGTLEDDQNRRDFTINALALCLNKDRFGELIDPFGGLEGCVASGSLLNWASSWNQIHSMLLYEIKNVSRLYPKNESPMN